ncbi:hypothetical protein ACHHV8_07530 [Paenibacillus sp. TAB 01]|uniref:hypothetical protein n=1 Tax=Paenibacillus sp. TAB 01 TaxID=3368988 RepID=UPI0037521167
MDFEAVQTTSFLLIFITSGKLVYRVDNEDYPLQKGDVLMIPAGSFRCAKALEAAIKDMPSCSNRQGMTSRCSLFYPRTGLIS